jgi:hypothetical protein
MSNGSRTTGGEYSYSLARDRQTGPSHKQQEGLNPMTNRFGRLITAAAVLATAGAFVLPGTADAIGALPTITVALNGINGVTISGDEVSGAVSVAATFTGKVPSGPNVFPAFALVRLNPGVTGQQAGASIRSHGGDINALTAYASLFVSAAAPATVQTVLTPGNYVALNLTGNGQPASAPFTVTQSLSPAALPPPSATQTAIEFGFQGPTVLHNGTVVRAQNHGWLVHMIDLARVPHAATGAAVIALLRTGKDNQALRLLGPTPQFVYLLGPASPGAMQQQVLRALPGYYVETCFMDTQDGREHSQLGMLRLVRIV